MNAMASQIISVSMFTQTFVQTQIKKTKTLQLRLTGFCEGNSPVPDRSSYKGQ